MRMYHRHEFLTLEEAAKLLPGPPSESTLRRWSDHGTYGVRLRTYTADGQRVTTVEDILQFIAKQSDLKRLPEEIEEHYRHCEAELREIKARQYEATAKWELQEYGDEPATWGLAGTGRNLGVITWVRGMQPQH